MNKDSLREYIFAAQRGDRKALVELLTYSWGIVHYQCGKLLPSRQSAEKMTTVVLKTVAEKLDSLQEPERFYNWMGHLTAMRCMRVRATLLENGQADASEDKKSFSFPGMDLNKAETAQVAVMLADMLEDRQRLNLYLYSLSGLSAKAISQLTGYTEAAIQADLQDARPPSRSRCTTTLPRASILPRPKACPPCCARICCCTRTPSGRHRWSMRCCPL